MKKLLAAAALTVLIASPSLAQTRNGANARAAQINRPFTFPADTTNGPRGEVIRDGVVVGQDPDPAVRSEIAREWSRGQLWN